MKNLFTVCLTAALLSFGAYAQEEIQDTEYAYSHEAEAVLMILDKESSWPICRLSDQVKVNSEFIPENRISDTDMVSIEDIRTCQEEDVWNAVEEEMLVGMAVGPQQILLAKNIVAASAIAFGFIPGCAIGFSLSKTPTKDSNGEKASFLRTLRTLQENDPIANFVNFLMTVGGGSIGGFLGGVFADAATKSVSVLKHYPNIPTVALGLGALSSTVAAPVCYALFKKEPEQDTGKMRFSPHYRWERHEELP